MSQIVNGMLLPIMLYFILRLVNDRRIMGKYVNSPIQNIIAYGTDPADSPLVVMILTIFLPIFGVHLPG